MRLSDLSQHQRISELLKQLAHDEIDLEQFWKFMRQYGLTDADIDTLCRGENVE